MILGEGFNLKYKNDVIPSMMKILKKTNILSIPKITKVVLNMGAGKFAKDDKMFEERMKELTIIGGQKPIATLAKKSISGFNIRNGYKIGIKTTLRGKIMRNFLEILFDVALVRFRDFKGCSVKSVYGNKKGGYNLGIGIKDCSIFPGINRSSFDKTYGMDIMICTNSRTQEEAILLIEKLGMAFIERKDKEFNGS